LLFELLDYFVQTVRHLLPPVDLWNRPTQIITHSTTYSY
jgi:hypothetical protein